MTVQHETTAMTDEVPAPPAKSGFWSAPAVPPAAGPVDPTPATTHAGWRCITTTRELTGDLTRVQVGGRKLMIARRATGLELFDATCPHRGADLTVGGILRDDCVTCPFHGKPVLLGREVTPPRLGVARYPLLVVGDLLFARLDDAPSGERGFVAAMTAHQGTHQFFAGSSVHVDVDPQFVIENAYDVAHFTAVHGVARAQLELTDAADEALAIDGHLEYPAPAWVRAQLGETIRNRFHATSYSPTLVVTEVGDRPDHHLVITTAEPEGDGARVRVGYGIAPDRRTGVVNPRIVAALIEGGAVALAEDVPVWANLDPTITPLYDVRDAPVRAYRDWCGRFPTAPR